MKRALCLILFAGFLSTLAAQLLIVTFAEITGDAATHAVSTSTVCRWVLFVGPSTNSAVVRIGDSNTSVSRGIPVAAGGGYMMPPTNQAPGYDLTRIYYYAGTGDKLDVSCAK